MNDPTESEAAIAQVRREFCASLPARLRALRAARASLSTGYDSHSAEVFFLQAHSLEGTAGAFEAAELEAHARVLAAIGRKWRDGQSVSDDDIQAAGEAIDRLAEAVERYRSAVE